MVEKNYNLYVHISPSKKIYIGITKQKAENRWSNGYGYNRHPYFYNAIKKYGWDNIKHVVLFTDLTKNEAQEKEKKLIALHDATNPKYGYNMSTGGECGASGLVCSEETKRKLSKINKGKKLSEKTKIKIGMANKGKIISKETREKQSFANRGQVVSKETRIKLSKAMKGKKNNPFTEETRLKISKAMKGKANRQGKYMRKIACIDLSTNEELVFDNINEAVLYIKDNVYPMAKAKSIYSYCSSQVNGYKHKWRYIEGDTL